MIPFPPRFFLAAACTLNALLFIFLFSFDRAYAVQWPEKPKNVEPYTGFLGLILKDKNLATSIPDERPDTLNKTAIYHHDAIDTIETDNYNISACHTVLPYAIQSWPQQAGRAARVLAANSPAHIESITLQPRFSGLRGPALTLMRGDLERAVLHHAASPAEIHHNARFGRPKHRLCKSIFRLEVDITLKTQIDLGESNEAPLYSTGAIATARALMGHNFMGSLGIKVPIQDNLYDDPNFFRLGINDSPAGTSAFITQFEYYLDHATLNAFYTPYPDMYLALQGGFLEERFFGFGGELLYRPFGKPWAIGADLWGTMKRNPFDNAGLSVNQDNTQFSAFLNGYYDLNKSPLSFGVSGGRFLDGDYGGEVKAMLKPKPGWRIDAFARYSFDEARNLDNDKTNVFGGLRLTIPLEQLKGMPENSRADTDFMPFGRDKAQRIDNHYPLYQLTDPWSTANTYQNWNDILK